MAFRFHEHALGLGLAAAFDRALLSCLALPLVLAALAPAPLRAEAKLELVDLPASVLSGTTLRFNVRSLDGLPPSPFVRVNVRVGTEAAFSTIVPMNDSGFAQVALPIPPLDTAKDLRIGASDLRGESGIVRVRLEPGRPVPAAPPDPADVSDAAPGREEKAPDAAPATFKRYRPEGPGSSSSSSAPAPPDRLSALPTVILNYLSTFTGVSDLRPVSGQFAQMLPSRTRRMVIKGDLNDVELLNLLRTRPNLRSIAFSGPGLHNLTGPGIQRALRHCPVLEELRIHKFIHGLNPRCLGGITRNHPSLVTLEANLVMFTPEQLDYLPDHMVRLTLDCPVADDHAFQRFGNLQHLDVRARSPFRGEHLPATLRSLVVRDGLAFTGRNLPGALQDLTVHECPEFNGTALPPTLTRLEVSNCRRFAAVAPLPNLEQLNIRRCHAVTPEVLAAAVGGQPALTSLVTDKASPALMNVLPAGLTSLSLRTLAPLGREDFNRFQGLERLALWNDPGFTGAQLPDSLRSLSVGYSPQFRSESLARTRLDRLQVTSCPAFNALGLPPGLRRLTLLDCPVRPVDLLGAVRCLASLRELVVPGRS